MASDHVVHLSVKVINSNTGATAYRIFCSCGWDSSASESKRLIWSRLLKHAPEHDRSCRCWS